jgi:hypothetical protein
MLTEQGTFIHGIVIDGKAFRIFTLEEEVMRHTFLVSNDFTLDRDRLAGDEKKKIAPDAAYFSACLLAARLNVTGVDTVTPEMVEDLPKDDAQLLLFLSAQIEVRRELFRKKTETAEDGHPGTHETGLPGGGSTVKKQRGGKGHLPGVRDAE